MLYKQYNMQLTKVTFHYSDGSQKFLTDGELDKWSQMNSQVAGLAHIHGMNPDWDSIKWSTVPSAKEEQENYLKYKAEQGG